MAHETDQLAAEVDEILDRIATNVDQLVDAVHPKSIARRTWASFRGRFVDAEGNLRTETVVPVVGGAVALVVGAIVIRRVVR